MSGNHESSRKPTVLVAEDLPEDIAILSELLRDEYHVRVATGGEAALTIARSDAPPDLILLDVMMPDMDGLETCRRLNQERATSTIPVIFVTAKDAAADESLGFAAGGVDYITKPVNPHLVRARVKAHLELKKAREELEQQNEILMQNARLLEEVEAINRHDLKNPLMIIMNVPSLLMASASLQDSERKLLGMVENAGRQMLEMINRTIDLFKMEKGAYTYSPAKVEVARVIEQIVTALHASMGTKKLSVDVTLHGGPFSPNDNFCVMADQLLLYSVLSNLVKNSVDASPEGGRISISLTGTDSATIAIHNAGAIPSQIRSRFFEKFTTAGKQGGTGLGAYSARLMVRTMKGDIGFETSEERGTTVTVTLPRG
jgi:two-component system, sensor histidine kinase and response regulator